ncbi:hypothetical protein [Lactiplantibacillus modestisalitolerans]|nr:hypothetical protein [Lactiplantibacillus modestisalitolerans]
MTLLTDSVLIDVKIAASNGGNRVAKTLWASIRAIGPPAAG